MFKGIDRKVKRQSRMPFNISNADTRQTPWTNLHVATTHSSLAALVSVNSSSVLRNMDDDFDFDRAASAFPDLDLDGQGDVPLPSAPVASSGFSFDDFGSPLGQTEVKVTGDDEIEKFEDQFPELNIGQVSDVRSWVSALY
jgi:hypothetical protein